MKPTQERAAIAAERDPATRTELRVTEGHREGAMRLHPARRRGPWQLNGNAGGETRSISLVCQFRKGGSASGSLCLLSMQGEAA